LMILVPALHRDPAIWGSDPEAFDPERFAPDAVKARPANAYKPFGTGFRSCIGRHFALQEAILALAMILQRFELVDHTGYELKLKQTLTIKPEGFRIKVRARTDRPSETKKIGGVPEESGEREVEVDAPATIRTKAPLLILYGSNTGTCEAIAGRIAEDATVRGFTPTIAELDQHVDDLPINGAVIIVASSYNGTPADNAARFVEWLESASLAPDAFAGVRYTVFGCGDHDWADTFQRIPRLVDERLQQHGAERIKERGEGDQSDDMDGQFREWYDDLFPVLADALNLAPPDPSATVLGHRYEIEILEPLGKADTLVAEFGARPASVVENRELQRKDGPKPSERSTRHLVLRLPDGVTYHEGDHLGMLPRNDPALVQRVQARFGLPGGAHVTIRKNFSGKSFLPVDRPVPVALLLSGFLALQDPATRSDLAVLADYAETASDKAALKALSGDDPESSARYREAVLDKNRSLLDILEDLPSCQLPFNLFVELAPVLKPRYYSISSSPLASPDASITVGVVEGPARSGHGIYRGVASRYVSDLGEGDLVECYVRAPNVPFVPPADPATPMIMVGAGTGIAPYRGFLQARAARKARGDGVGPALLFHGCRNAFQDQIYAEEFQAFERDGVVELQMAYSRPDGGEKCYVQDRIHIAADRVLELVDQGGIVYVCGDAATMAPAVQQAFLQIAREKRGLDEVGASAWLAQLKADSRYVVDIWPKN
jgi:cytochrome P450 / NADPH-cytochrome P450 reductase